MRLAAPSTIIAGALATAAIASPLASARFDLQPTTTGQTQASVTATVVRPNPDQQVTQVSQVGPPTLQSAKPSQLSAVHRAETAASHASAYRPVQSGRYSIAGLNGYVSSPHPVPAVVHVTTHSNPFDWGDAAVGAAGGLVISLLIIGGGVVVTQRRQPKATRAKVLA